MKEGYDHFDINIVQSGDIMFDASLFYKAKADFESTIIKDLNLTAGDYVLATIHRQENTDEFKRLLHIIDALNTIHQQRTVIVPIHPRTRKLIEQQNIDVQFKLIDPVGYLDMISLTSNAALVMTDSGGLQKEAFFFGKYCITLRDQTEWVELVEGNFNFLAGADREVILQAYFENAAPKSSFNAKLYGDGHAAKKIIDAMLL
jgi:UDP-GlcNAc3NAcA epimerase